MASKKTKYEFWCDVLGSPKYVAAPMVDMSELAFRDLCRRYNSQLCFTPMLHSQQFVQDSLYRFDSFSTTAEDRPLFVQFCANNPTVFVEAARYVSSQCDAVDLNLGCPQAIAKKGHYGAFLQDEWDLTRSIVQQAASELSVPVTCKMRILPGSSVRSVEYARMLEDAGCSVLTVHGRTRFQKGHDTGLASWETIRDIKQSLHIPVIANGNILTFEDVKACLAYTGADAVMSAEGLLHNPALFSGKNPPVWVIAEEYLDLAETHNTPLRYVRNHMYRFLYLCLHQDTELRTSLEEASSFEDFRALCKYVEIFPSKMANESDLSPSIDSDDILSSLYESMSENLHIEELFSPYRAACDTESFTFKNLVNLELDSAVNSSPCDILQSTNELSLEKNGIDVRSNGEKECYLPVWLCHSRPRISGSGNRGCYSKYFNSDEQKKEESEGIHLSKRQQRKARHYTRVLASMKENRKAKKLRRKQKCQELKENGCGEQRTKQSNGIPRREMKQLIKQRLIAARGNSPKICIDLRYSSEMNIKELNRLSSQLRRLYGSNRQAEKPVHLYFCSFCKTDPLYEICVTKNDGFSSYLVDMVDASPEDLFPSNEITYLSPDSENVLTNLDANKVYVIGGIVDSSVKKGLSLGTAQGSEVQTACLPIRQRLVSEGSGTTVLTVNQVFDILLTFYKTGDWVEALCAGVPQRKGFRAPDVAVETEVSNVPSLTEPTCTQSGDSIEGVVAP